MTEGFLTRRKEQEFLDKDQHRMRNTERQVIEQTCETL